MADIKYLLWLYEPTIGYHDPGRLTGDIATDLEALTHRAGPPFPTVQELEALVPQMESDFAIEAKLKSYRGAYTDDEFKEAFFEEKYEGKPDKLDAIQVKRLAIKAA